MAMSGFICHDDYLSKTAKLTDEEVGRLFRALMKYHTTGEETEISGRESIAFDFIREDIDRTEQAYKAKCDKNRENRLSAIENNRQRSLTTVNVPAQKEKEKEKEEDKEKENKKDNKKFIPPSVDEVRAFCQERGNNIDPEYFIAYNENRNWTLSNGRKMKDWKLAVITWEKNNFSKPAQGAPRKVVAQQYSQRDYSTANEADDFDRLYQFLESS